MGSTARHRPRLSIPIVTSVAAGLLLGALTAFGQGWLSDSARSVSNSAGLWCLVAFLVAVTVARRSVSALIGFLTLLALLAGYVLASADRGYESSTSLMVFWGLAAVVVGPVLGIAAHEVRRGPPMSAALGIAVMSGILVGEGAYGLLYIAETTNPLYWWSSIGVGIGLLVGVFLRRLRQRRPVAVAVMATAVVATAFVLLYSGDFIGLFG